MPLNACKCRGVAAGCGRHDERASRRGGRPAERQHVRARARPPALCAHGVARHVRRADDDDVDVARGCHGQP
eukprot:910556-Prymnesium_polylepis.1